MHLGHDTIYPATELKEKCANGSAKEVSALILVQLRA